MWSRRKTTPVRQLLKECGWNSVRQEIYYHTVLQVHKTMTTRAPHYLYNKLTEDGRYPRNTRQASVSTIRMGPTFQTRLTLTKDSFRWRGAAWHEVLAREIREEMKIGKFKKKLDTWVKTNISI